MKRLILTLLFLVGCSRSPGSFDAKITRVWYKPFSTVNGIDSYSEKYGTVTIYESPFYDKARVGDSVTIGCDDVQGMMAPSGCDILKLSHEQK